MYEQAFAYHVNGYAVIPIKKDKKPALMSWKKYQTEFPVPDQIKSWWNEKTNFLLGIVTGKISGIIVIDCDNDEGANQKQADDLLKKFPKTFTVRTGNGGYQLYYKYIEGFTISARAYPQYPGLDIRADGGYVVAPPSVTGYESKKSGKMIGGEYILIDPKAPVAFPIGMFPAGKGHKKLSAMLNVPSGSRNDSIASFIGKLLQSSREDEWQSEVWPAVERANKTYIPPLEQKEIRSTFDSIVKKEKTRRENLIISPMQLDGGEKIEIRIRKNKTGLAYKDMANVLAVLAQHPYYKDTIKYNEFKQEIEYNGRSLEDADLVKIQYFMQTDAELHSINKEAVYSAISHYAYKNKYDEAQDWIKSLVWDKTPRLQTWLSVALGIEDSSYHQGIGAQWLTGSIRRIMKPGCIFDYVLVLVGPQGVGKTSFFRILGGEWYKSYTGQVESKDFYLALRGAIIVDLDEGATLYRSEAIKMKSIITETHDEYRAPYDRVMKKYPRRFVFSTSTNDTEPFRDITGNRRYWTIDFTNKVDFKWLEENRDQLFAEAYYYFVNKIDIPEVPILEALKQQEAHLPDDSWTTLVVDEIRRSVQYCQGDEEYHTTILEIFRDIFPQESVARLGKAQEMRIAYILKKFLGMEKRQIMIDGERVVKWRIKKEKAEELRNNNANQKKNDLDKLVDGLSDKKEQKPLEF